MKFITLTAAGALIAGAATAGGVNPAPVDPAPVMATPAPVMSGNDWTGGYAGASLGYGLVDQDGIAGLEDDDTEFFGDDDITFDVDGDGAIGGVFAGYQYDFGNFVLGGELDLNAANLDFDDDSFSDFFDENDIDEDSAVSIDQIHRLKLRAGYDMGNTLVYGVAGAAYAEAEVFGEDYNDTGYLLGAGVDYKIRPNVTVGGEVLYHNFDDFDDTGVDLEATTLQARVAYQF